MSINCDNVGEVWERFVSYFDVVDVLSEGGDVGDLDEFRREVDGVDGVLELV